MDEQEKGDAAPVHCVVRRRIVQIAVSGVENTRSTQCNVVTVALCDDGSVWESTDQHGEWRQYPDIPQTSAVAKAFRTALAIIRNDANSPAWDHAPQHRETRMRWCDELEAEAGVREFDMVHIPHDADECRKAMYVPD